MAFIVLLLCPAHAAEPLSREYQVKAAYLYKLADYIDWPAAAFDSPDSPLTICVFGRDPFGSALNAVVAGERAAGRGIVVKRASAPDVAFGCHVAYITPSKDDVLVQQLALFIGKPVLTVTDGAGNEGGSHGIVDFVIQDDRVRFNIDSGLAVNGGLAISSKLLNLALKVRTNSRGGSP